MKYPKNLAIFLFALFLLTVASCKSNNSKSTTEEKPAASKGVKVSGSSIKVASEFLDAGMKGDFKRIAELCCKINGPYTSFEDVKRTDLGSIGFIEKILREEDSEADPDNLKLVVVRAKVLGEIGFYCFFVFKTPAGFKIYLDGDYLRTYPQEKSGLARTALDFYFSNRINLEKAANLAAYLISLNPGNIDTHYKLAKISIYDNKKQNAISEIKTILSLEENSYYISQIENEYLVATANELFNEGTQHSKVRSLRLFSRIPFDNNFLSILDKAMQDKDGQVRLAALSVIKNIDKDKSIPFYEKALKDEEVSIVKIAARALIEFGNDNAKGILINILSDELKPLIDKSFEDKGPLQRMGVGILEELERLNDVRAAPVLVYGIMLQAAGILDKFERPLLRIGEPAIPFLEKALQEKEKYRIIWDNRSKYYSDAHIQTEEYIQELINRIKNR